MKSFFASAALLLAAALPTLAQTDNKAATSGNPVFKGWYADPEGAVLDGQYWIFPTFSALYEDQTFFDAFSSPDLVTWTKHPRVLEKASVSWAQKAMWAPAVIGANGKYYFFFSANDVHEGEVGGIGVATADRPEGPYRDALGKPLISHIVNGAQPIDQFVFRDDDGQYYMYYGGWGHCNMCRLAPDLLSVVPFEDGKMFHEVTPENYVEGPFMLKRGGKYYFMWSEGGWGGPDYSVAYAISDSPAGPFRRVGKILQQDPKVATGAGHHSVIKVPGKDEYYIVYHRRPLNETGRDCRVTCVDRLEFNADGTIRPVKMTFEGVKAQRIDPAAQDAQDAPQRKTYTNPVTQTSLPDPTVTRGDDGYFYLYATEDIHNLPVYRSRDLVDWSFAGTAFNDSTRPKWNPGGGIWAPDINRIGNRYVLYYAKSKWGGEWDCGVGVATATRPEGPFTDHGALFTSREIGVQNSIDPFFIDDDGHKYLFWGSFRGIYGIELTDDGLAVRPGAVKRQVAGTFMEAAYIHKRGGYYYLFGSAGTCCEGEKSTYRVTVGRSRDLFGPYVDKEGRALLDNHFEVVVHRNDSVVGPGHNAEIVTDDRGEDWMLMHGFKSSDPDAGRVAWLCRVKWNDGWPTVEGDSPAREDQRPEFGQLRLADPTILADGGTYYLYGTSPKSSEGFWAYTSTDLSHWSGPAGTDDGYVLRGNGHGAFGTTGFWAPQVMKRGGKYLMAYTANEQLAIAESDSPLGPFTQPKVEHMPAGQKQIDPFVFFDTDGKAYLYHVRLDRGNRIYVAELNADLKSVREETARECVHAGDGWENTAKAEWPVCEGPTVVKVDKTYYLFFSCNDFRNPDYAVGYATSKSPLGPWKKASKPLFSRADFGINGTGHGDLFRDNDGQWQYVFHVHDSNSNPSPRRTAIVGLTLKGKKWSVTPGTFRLLEREDLKVKKDF